MNTAAAASDAPIAPPDMVEVSFCRSCGRTGIANTKAQRLRDRLVRGAVCSECPNGTGRVVMVRYQLARRRG